MNILIHEFPKTVWVSGVAYPIVTDFREWIKLSELLTKTERLTRQVLDMILEWYIGRRPEDEVKAVRALQDFMLASAIYPPSLGYGEETEDIPERPVFSFEQDAICIYCAFLEVYGIDIESIPYMHWWKFRVLFEGLPADTEIKERIYYRSVNLNDIKDKEERKRIKEIKKKIALRTPRRKLDDYQIGEMFN